MYLYLKNNKIEIKKAETLVDKIKSFRFKLDEIDYGILLEDKKIFNTYFFCQNIDVIYTDKNNKILKILRNVKSEKILIAPKNTSKTFLLKSLITKNLDIDDKLKIK